MRPHISSLYVNRPLVNAEEFLDWAAQQGFESVLDPDDLHVTLAFSKRALPWDRLEPVRDHHHVSGGDRSISPLGDEGALVLHFDDPKLTDRWQQICDAGASWEHEGFRPHITITYDSDDIDHQMIEPYGGPLIFGPEEFSPVVDHWEKSIQEIPLVAENIGLLAHKSQQGIKYGESITEYTRMTDLSSLLIKNIDLILEAYNVDPAGNLVVANTKKVREAEEVFHQYFVKSMNNMFRQINEADPILHDPNGMGMPQHGIDGLGMGGPEMMGNMNPMAGGGHPMGQGHEEADAFGMGEPDGHHPMDQMDHMSDPGLGGGSMGGMAPHGMGGMAPHGMGESYDWLSEDPDLDIDALFDLQEEEQLDEFMGHGHGDEEEMMGGQMGGSMDHMGGANDMGGDMGGMGDADPMELDSGMDHHGGGMMGGGDDMGGGGEMGGDDGDMVTIHGTTDSGADFEFSFDPNTLGFDDLGGDGGMGGEHDDMGGIGGEDHEMHGHDGGGEEHGHHGMDHMDEPGMGEDEEEEPMAEGMVKKGKPGKGVRGPKTARMAVVPADPAVGHAAPFPTAQGQRQKRK